MEEKKESPEEIEAKRQMGEIGIIQEAAHLKKEKWERKQE